MSVEPFPRPQGRRTHGAYRTPDEAVGAAQNLVRLLNGIPWGYQMAVFERLGAFVVLSYPRGEA